MSISSIEEDLLDIISIPTFSNLAQCLNEVTSSRDIVIGNILKSDEYLNSLHEVFEYLEDLEEWEGLAVVYRIVQGLSKLVLK
jgi:Fe2+ or Zn2+ uptake regulation protein